MAGSSRTTMAKRQRERARQDKQREKAERKAQRKLDKKNGIITPDDDMMGTNDAFETAGDLFVDDDDDEEDEPSTGEAARSTKSPGDR